MTVIYPSTVAQFPFGQLMDVSLCICLGFRIKCQHFILANSSYNSPVKNIGKMYFEFNLKCLRIRSVDCQKRCTLNDKKSPV